MNNPDPTAREAVTLRREAIDALMDNGKGYGPQAAERIVDKLVPELRVYAHVIPLQRWES